MSFNQGDRVMTPGGAGEVVYKRMAAPDYTHVAAYSVKLDHARHNPLYTGSLYPANEVKEEVEEDTVSDILKQLSHGAP